MYVLAEIQKKLHSPLLLTSNREYSFSPHSFKTEYA
ncbi:hypothetical protein BBR47_03520 [Brevibacillus brevis NBRC 100599]|uniref:Uncharacterized protein n=1 Tax=Brevibacillus brevis (strain 47 / JCM 6285 / NBRC 100599) TaxID=358681 RepID=C0ZIW1_BREBN|nr:hypothetical protein BBR47_03520 [Brevibacillus brevis NBRC 100599]